MREPASHFPSEIQASKERCSDSHPPDPAWPSDDGDEAIDLRRTVDEFLSFDASEGGHAARHWPELISKAFPTLVGKPLADQLLALVLETKRRRGLTRGGLQVIEYFAGAGMIAYFAILNKLQVAQFDKCYSNAHDCQTALGLRNWMDALMDTAADAWAWMASQCSSWVILCRYNSKRSDANQYLGDIDKPFVQEGNYLMAITSLLFFLARLIDVNPVVEQPLNSCMGKAPPFSTVLKFDASIRTSTYLEAFGAPSAKPLQLWHSNDSLSSIKRTINMRNRAGREKLYTVSASPLGRRRFSGKKKDLKQSQQYPWQFGLAVVQIMTRSKDV